MEYHENRDRLIHVLESATKVFRSSQFFAWTQGPLQAVLPHEIMVCGMPEGASRELRMRYFTATPYFKAEHFEAACNPRNGLITQLVSHWKVTRQPCLVPPLPDAPPCDPQWDVLMHRLELHNMAAHGQLASDGGLGAWFGFFRVGEMGYQTAMRLELLLPCITATYARMLSHEADASSGQTTFVASRLSRREIQVLELVRDGCSNQEIAERLAISAMTAKNHVQHIRTKLNVRTRGQAVAEGLRLVIIRPKRDES